MRGRQVVGIVTSIIFRFSTKYDINDFVNLKLSSTYNRFERVGSDPFADVNLVTGIQPITIPSTYIKIVSGFGVGVSLLNKKLISETFVKNYYLETESASLNFSQSLTEKLFDRSFRWGQSFKYAFDQDTFVRVSYEDAIRIPDAEEFFGDNLFILPNPALRPESSDNLNIGFSTNINSSKTIFAEVNAFYRNTKDFIQRFPLGLINSINRNSDSQEVKGIEGNKAIFYLASRVLHI